MSKKIEDFIHLYLGCFCAVQMDEDKPELTIGELVEVGKNYALIKSHPNDCEVSLFEVKPILRPLSDMTEDELVDLLKIASLFDLSECEFDIHNDDTDVWVNAEMDGRVIDSLEFKEHQLEPEQFHYLLSKHFDLFGLIEAGLAIDATTLKHQ